MEARKAVMLPNVCPTYKRYLTMACAALAAGLPAVLRINVDQLVYSLVFSVGLIIALGLLAIFVVRWRGFWLALLLAAVGFSLNGYRLLNTIDAQLPPKLEGEDIAISGEVVSLPKVSYYGAYRRSSHFYFRLDSINLPAEQWRKLKHRNIRLSWYQPHSAAAIEPGQRWQFTVRLKRPRGTANPAGFDYQAWLLAQGIVATGYVRDRELIELLPPRDTPSFNRWRFQIAEQLFPNQSISNNTSSSLLRALLIGDKSFINQAQWQVLRNTGTVHLMAISGLHIGLLAMLGFWLGRILAHLLSLKYRAGIGCLPAVFAIGAAVVYAGLAGFAIPTQRALVMVVLFSVALATGRRLNYWYVFLFAMILVVGLDPFAFLSVGFWLSFAAVGVLVAAFGWRKSRIGRGDKLVALVKAQFWIMLGLLLPLSLLGLPVSLAAPLANIVAVPFISFITVPLLILAVLVLPVAPVMAGGIATLAATSLDSLWGYLAWLSQLDLHSYLGPVNQPLGFVASVIAVLLLVSPRGLHLRWAGLGLIVVLLFPSSYLHNPKQPPLAMTVLDVQQGLAVVIKTPNHTLVYDTGARFSDDFDMGSRVVAPFLRSQRRYHIDTLMISHGDNDHAGGVAALLSEFNVGQVLSGEPQRLSILNTPVEACEQGQQWQFDGVEFSVLWPNASSQARGESNNDSCVLWVKTQDTSFLLMGDVESSVERELLASDLLPRKVDVLLVPHHGSATSSSNALVKHVQPRFAVFSAGFNNRYHHPHKKILARYQKKGATILRTDLQGAIDVRLNKSGQLQVDTSRANSPRPWY